VLDLAERHADRPVIIAADTNGVDKAEAAARACRGIVVLPDLQGAEGTDFNDQAAHYGLAALQDDFDVHVVTTNFDDLHERAGSTHVIHLHGNIAKMRSEKASSTTRYDIAGDIHLGDVAEDGGQLMPDIVWFGEPVPEIGTAAALAASADIFVVIGTTLSVYPAAGLVDFVRPETLKFLIDKSITRTWGLPNLVSIEKPATQGVPELINRLHQYRSGQRH